MRVIRSILWEHGSRVLGRPVWDATDSGLAALHHAACTRSSHLAPMRRRRLYDPAAWWSFRVAGLPDGPLEARTMMLSLKPTTLRMTKTQVPSFQSSVVTEGSADTLKAEGKWVRGGRCVMHAATPSRERLATNGSSCLAGHGIATQHHAG